MNWIKLRLQRKREKRDHYYIRELKKKVPLHIEHLEDRHPETWTGFTDSEKITYEIGRVDVIQSVTRWLDQ
jgi:hypothetical protein